MTNVRGQGIARLYQDGGTALMAYKLRAVFARIEKSDDDARVRHNDMIADVFDIINNETRQQATTRAETRTLSQEENGMLMFIARLLRERRLRRAERKSRFLLALGGWIMHIGQSKG